MAAKSRHSLAVAVVADKGKCATNERYYTLEKVATDKASMSTMHHRFQCQPVR